MAPPHATRHTSHIKLYTLGRVDRKVERSLAHAPAKRIAAFGGFRYLPITVERFAASERRHGTRRELQIRDIGIWHDCGMIEIRDRTEADGAMLTSASVGIGGPVIVCRGRLVDLWQYTALIAGPASALTGFLVWRLRDRVADVLGIVAVPPGAGTGSALMRAFFDRAAKVGTQAVGVETTDDNEPALAFYRRHGFQETERIEGGFADVLRFKGLPVDQPVRGHGGALIRDLVRLERPV